MGKVSRRLVSGNGIHTNTRSNKAKKKKPCFSQRRKVSDKRVNDAAMASIEPAKKTSDKSLFKRFCMRCENGADWIHIGFLKLVRSCYISFTNDQDAIDKLDLDIATLKNDILERNGKEKIMKPNRPVYEIARSGDVAGAAKNLCANVKDRVGGVAQVATAKIGKAIS